MINSLHTEYETWFIYVFAGGEEYWEKHKIIKNGKKKFLKIYITT